MAQCSFCKEEVNPKKSFSNETYSKLKNKPLHIICFSCAIACKEEITKDYAAEDVPPEAS